MLYKNKKTGKIGVIDLTVNTNKGILHTIKYIDGTYRRYYENTLNSNFIQYDNATNVPEKETVSKRDNVIFVDFKNKCKIA